MAYKDYYKILGVDKTAAADVIKKAYRKLAMKHHPDQNPGDKVAEEKFKEINEANEVLSNPDKRKRYDEFGENWEYLEKSGGNRQQQQRNRGSQQYNFTADDFADDAHFKDIFEKFFGGSFGGMGGGSSQQRYSTNHTAHGVSGQDAVLEFQVVIDGIIVNGIDMMTCNEEGQVVDFKVMLRPLKAVHLIQQKMMAMLQNMGF